MSSASDQGFCCFLPARLGVLVISSLTFLGSAILAGFTLHSLANQLELNTAIQTAGFSLVFISWIALAAFTFFCFISAVLRRPSFLLISSRLIIYHLPANLLCNVFFIAALLSTYHDLVAIANPKACAPNSTICAQAASIGILAWVHLWILLPVLIAQIYLYILIKRFISVVDSGRPPPSEEELYEVKEEPAPPTRGEVPLVLDDKRQDSVTYSVGSKVRRSKLRVTMEKSTLGEPGGDSFLPSMIFSPTDLGPSQSLSQQVQQPPPAVRASSLGLPSSPRSTVIMGKGVVSSSSSSPPQSSPLRPSTPAAASPAAASDKGESSPPMAKALPLLPRPRTGSLPPPAALAPRQPATQPAAEDRPGRDDFRMSVASMAATSESAHVEEQFGSSISSSKREEMWNRYWG